MTSNTDTQIKIINPSIFDINMHKIIMGFITSDSLPNLKIASYQREEVISEGYLINLKTAILDSILPPIELGMRGSDYKQEDSILYINSDVYIIDGLQRVSACKAVVAEQPSFKPLLQCMIFIDSKESWEMERFEIMNTCSTQLPSVGGR